MRASLASLRQTHSRACQARRPAAAAADTAHGAAARAEAHACHATASHTGPHNSGTTHLASGCNQRAMVGVRCCAKYLFLQCRAHTRVSSCSAPAGCSGRNEALPARARAPTPNTRAPSALPAQALAVSVGARLYSNAILHYLCSRPGIEEAVSDPVLPTCSALLQSLCSASPRPQCVYEICFFSCLRQWRFPLESL